MSNPIAEPPKRASYVFCLVLYEIIFCMIGKETPLIQNLFLHGLGEYLK